MVLYLCLCGTGGGPVYLFSILSEQPKSNPLPHMPPDTAFVQRNAAQWVALAGDGGHRGDRRAGHLRAHGSAWNVSKLGADYRIPYSLSKDYWLYERRVERLRPEILP